MNKDELINYYFDKLDPRLYYCNVSLFRGEFCDGFVLKIYLGHKLH